MKELGGKYRSVSRAGPAFGGRGTESGVWSPHWGNCLESGETFKAESEKADLWQPKWNENQAVLVMAIHTLNREAHPLEGTMAGSWSLGTVEQSQGKHCYWLWRNESRGCEGGGCGGKYLWRKAGQPWKQGDTAESCVGGGAITIVSPPTGQH